MQKVGARLWIPRIMISWGIVSMGMALVQNTTSLYIVRFLLGAAEAGFFPGVVLYLTGGSCPLPRAHYCVLYGRHPAR